VGLGGIWWVSIIRLFIVLLVLFVLFLREVFMVIFLVVNGRCLDRRAGSFDFDTGTTGKRGQIVAIRLGQLCVDEIGWQWRILCL
jgi:hypothetical protein